MANNVYGYNPSSSARGATPAHSSLYSTSRYLSSDTSKGVTSASIYLSQNEALRSAAADMSSRTPHLITPSSWAAADVSASLDSTSAGTKRPSEVLYHRTILDAHNTIGQTEAWYTTNSLAKRLRFENTSNLPIYPQRPGEKDCAHYMLTRTCKFGDTCIFDHPIWVPEGGIPNWKEVAPVTTSEYLPERPRAPDCQYFLKTQRCEFGIRCRFNHPKDKLSSVGVLENADVSTLPERPSEPLCSFYMKTGSCKFGATCKFHHPKDILVPLSGLENGNGEQSELAGKTDRATGSLYPAKPPVSFTPALLHNTKGLPIRPGEVDCPFYLKTGSCKYGITCRYNHPDRNAISPLSSAFVHPLVASAAANLNIGVVNPASSLYHTIDPGLVQSTLQVGVGSIIYPQRPGQIECDHYMKTGECKFGERCRFHHPVDRSEPTDSSAEENVKLTLAGLPRREGAVICPYYLKTGTCKYGATCKFDHPPPGEVMSIAVASQEVTDSVGEKATEGENVGRPI